MTLQSKGAPDNYLDRDINVGEEYADLQNRVWVVYSVDDLVVMLQRVAAPEVFAQVPRTDFNARVRLGGQLTEVYGRVTKVAS